MEPKIETAPTPAPSKPAKKVKIRTLRPGYKLSDGMVIQKETVVEVEEVGGVDTITGPKGLRPAVLIGSPYFG